LSAALRSEIALGRAFGASLVDIIVQINAVRLLIAEHQLAQVRNTVGSSNEPVVIADASGRGLFANDAFASLARRAPGAPLDNLASLFSEQSLVRSVLASLVQERQPWRGELSLAVANGKAVPVAVRAEVVPARDGSVLGFFIIFVDLTDSQRAAEARRHLEQSLTRPVDDTTAREDLRTAGDIDRGDVIGAILANASLAAMDIADGGSAPSIAPLLEEVEVSTRRASELYERIRLFES